MMERAQQATSSKVRKRKAENQDNERLSKRLSLLNLERNGQKLYVPVETSSSSPSAIPPFPVPIPIDSQSSTSIARSTNGKQKQSRRQTRNVDDDMMQVDNTSHKVYIYDLDAELSSSDNESEEDVGRLVFLPDIEKHLRSTRIPPAVLANSEGELAGNDLKQLVLYNVPSSLSVPQEKDSVRKAIIESRARQRVRQEEERRLNGRGEMGAFGGQGREEVLLSGGLTIPVSQEAMDLMSGGGGAIPVKGAPVEVDEYDPDAMDLG